MGVVTPVSETLAEFVEVLRAGRSAITHWHKLDERIHSKVGGDLTGFDLRAHFARVGAAYPRGLVERALRLLRNTPLPGRLAAAAALQACAEAGWLENAPDLERYGHVLAGHNLNQRYISENTLALQDEPDFIDPLYGMLFLDTDVLSVVSELVGVKGPSYTVGGACASGTLALIAGLDMIRIGRAPAVLVTGGPVDLDLAALQGWALLNTIAIRAFNDEPARASRPFDRRREGFVPAQASGALVLESLASARARGARVYAEILGAATASDATRLPKPIMEGQVRVMRGALHEAGIAPEEIDYVNAHATSTVAGDVVEVEAIKTVLGAHARRIPVNATKSIIGHCLTSAGVVEFVATLLQMAHGFVHPTINLEEPEPGLDLDFVPNAARPYRIARAMKNSFGFGGLNACLVVGRVE